MGSPGQGPEEGKVRGCWYCPGALSPPNIGGVRPGQCLLRVPGPLCPCGAHVKLPPDHPSWRGLSVFCGHPDAADAMLMSPRQQGSRLIAVTFLPDLPWRPPGTSAELTVDLGCAHLACPLCAQVHAAPLPPNSSEESRVSCYDHRRGRALRAPVALSAGGNNSRSLEAKHFTWQNNRLYVFLFYPPFTLVQWKSRSNVWIFTYLYFFWGKKKVSGLKIHWYDGK